MDFDEIRKKATLPTSTLSLCLAGERVEEAQQLERKLAEAKPPTSLGDTGTKRAIAEQILAVQEQMREAMVDFHLRAFGSRAWTKFWATWPSRIEGEAATAYSDRLFPVHVELVARSLVDPVLSKEQVTELADLLHGAAWIDLVNACLTLNTGDVDIPNSDAASALIENSEQT